MATEVTRKLRTIGIEFDPEAQKELDMPLGTRELYPYPGMYVAEVLKEHDVRIAFGVPGGHIWHFIDAISRIGIRTITFGHEQNAVYAAEAYSQVLQKPAVAYGTVGPGVANAASPLQQAGLSNSPIIFLCGGHEPEHDKLYNTIQESYAQEVLGFAKWVQRIVYPHQVKQFMTRAFKVAQTHPMGPVVMEMPCTMLFSTREASDQMWWGAFGQHAEWIPQWRGEKTGKPMRSAGDPEEIAVAARKLMEAKRPFMVLGDGPTWSQAGPELEELINLAKIPFTTRRIGRAVVSEKHPYYYRGLPPFRKEIDLMVSVGVKVGFFDGYGRHWPETIQIAASEDHIWTYINTAAAIVGDPRLVARQLIDYIKAHNLQPPKERDEWIAKVQKAREDAVRRRRDKAMYYGFEHPRYRDADFMHYGYLSQAIADYLEEHYDSANRIIIDGYTMSEFVNPFIVATRPAQVLSASEQAGVGHGVGQAIGAAFAQLEVGDRTPILSLMGDSGMGNSGLDVEVAAKYRLPIVYLVTNNDGWMPGHKYPWYGENWEALGPQDRLGAQVDGIPAYGQERLPRMRWDKIGEACGAYGETVTNHKEFLAALDRAFKAAEKGQPAVLNCIMDKHLVNSAVTSPVYALMYQHLPWVDIPKRGKAARRTFWGKETAFKGLKDYPPMPVADFWEPLSEEEMQP